MCGEHEIDNFSDLIIREHMSDKAKELLAKSEQFFAEMCASGQIFCRPPTPIRMEQIRYG